MNIRNWQRNVFLLLAVRLSWSPDVLASPNCTLLAGNTVAQTAEPIYECIQPVGPEQILMLCVYGNVSQAELVVLIEDIAMQGDFDGMNYDYFNFIYEWDILKPNSKKLMNIKFHRDESAPPYDQETYDLRLVIKSDLSADYNYVHYYKKLGSNQAPEIYKNRVHFDKCKKL